MTLSIVVIDQRPTLVLLGLTIEGVLRLWRDPLRVVLEVGGRRVDAVDAAPALGSTYVLSVPHLGIQAPAGRSIVDAAQLLQTEILARLPRHVLEPMLRPAVENH